MPSEPGSSGAAPSRWRRSQYSWNQPTCPISQIGGSTKCCRVPSIWASSSPSSSSSSTRLASRSAARSASADSRRTGSSLVTEPVPAPSVSADGTVCTPTPGARALPTPRGPCYLSAHFPAQEGSSDEIATAPGGAGARGRPGARRVPVPGGSRPGADDQDRRPVRPLGAVLGGRVAQLLARRQDDDRP